MESAAGHHFYLAILTPQKICVLKIILQCPGFLHLFHTCNFLYNVQYINTEYTWTKLCFFNYDLKLITALTVHRIPFDMNVMAESDPVKFYHIFIFPNYLIIFGYL